MTNFAPRLTSHPAPAPVLALAAIADKMICVDSNSYYGPVRADPLLFNGDTCSGEADQTGTGTETG